MGDVIVETFSPIGSGAHDRRWPIKFLHSRGRGKPRRWRIKQNLQTQAGASQFSRVVHVRGGAGLEPVREQVERRAAVPDLRDVFLCHAWDDRQGAAKELHDLLEACGVEVWFSEKDIALGEPFLREIDRGLVKSRVGIVLVTPNFLERIHGHSIADKELSVLLHGGKLVPIIHGTTFAEPNEESPMLASRNGLNTGEDGMADVATKLADLVALQTR